MKKISILLIALTLPFSALAFNFAKPGEPSGKIVFNDVNPAKLLYQVELVAVNGENVPRRAHAVWLKPGEYELTLFPKLDNYAIKHMGLKERRNADRELVVVSFKVVAGKTYYLAYDARAEDSLDWQPISYKID
ncbi:MAG: hypothetical protein DWP95_04830 [Proteobacteria bacterium]|nr:MAG: hypothetical protein DWP95_04830 [Pseudomonadota bacterium]